MNDQLWSLLDLQELDAQISQINSQLAAMDGALAYRKRYAIAKKQFEAAEAETKSLEVELKDNELDLKSIDEKRSNLEKRMYAGGISNPKELSAVEKEIQNIKDRQSELDSRVLELYELVEAGQENTKTAKETFAEAEKRARAAIAKESAEKKKLEAELVALNEKRGEALKEITDRQLLSRYETIRKRTGSTGIAKVMDSRCQGCHVAVTAYTIGELIKGSSVQTCENCGRILVLVTE